VCLWTVQPRYMLGCYQSCNCTDGGTHLAANRPEESGRVTYLDLWDGSYTVQVKEGGVCGPGDNRFAKETVSTTTPTTAAAGGGGDKLVLQLKKNLSSGVWEASEVRIVNSDGRPFKYGNYTFFVESVAVKNASSGQTISDVLPANIVLGLFTWDPTDRYSVHENWNHEVDIEVSRWGADANADTQFLMQPPGSPQMYRFFSGSSPNTYDQSNHWHSFRWLPNEISWLSTSGGGQSHLYTTEQAVLSGCEDFVQCLPADVEIRINLWNMDGMNVAPRGLLNDDDYVEVVIGNFIYEEAGIDYASPGDYCSKHCQCEAPQGCVDGQCVGTTPAPVASTLAPVTSTPAPVASTSAPVASTSAPIASTPSPVASTPAPVSSTLAPVVTPTTSDCEIKTQVDNIETKVESMEIDVQNLESKLTGIEDIAATILSILQPAVTAAPITSIGTPAPVAPTPAPIVCEDRRDRWEINGRLRNWCGWARKQTDRSAACVNKSIDTDCPVTCGVCDNLTGAS